MTCYGGWGSPGVGDGRGDNLDGEIHRFASNNLGEFGCWKAWGMGRIWWTRTMSYPKFPVAQSGFSPSVPDIVDLARCLGL